MEVQPVNTIPSNFAYGGSRSDYLSEKFYKSTTGQLGTNAVNVFDILYEVHDNNLKNEFEVAVKKAYIRHNKVPFNSVSDVLKDELTGANEKWALAVYEDGDKNKAKVNFLDHLKSSFENLGDYFANSPLKALGELVAITAVALTKLPFWGKLIGAIGIITASDLIYNITQRSQKQKEAFNYKA